MLISFSGAQSTGKSTLLHLMQDNYPDRFNFIPEVTRLVKREWGVSINEVADADTTQLLILNQHLYNHMKYLKEGGDWIMDRCILDGYVYTKHFDVSPTVRDYARFLFLKIISDIDIIFYTNPSDVPLVDDGERSVNTKFREDIIKSFEYNIHEYFHKDSLHSIKIPKIIRLAGTVKERMDIIKKALDL